MVANEMGINGWIWNMVGVQINKTGLDKGMRDKESSRFQSWITGWHCHWRKSGVKEELGKDGSDFKSAKCKVSLRHWSGHVR